MARYAKQRQYQHYNPNFANDNMSRRGYGRAPRFANVNYGPRHSMRDFGPVGPYGEEYTLGGGYDYGNEMRYMGVPRGYSPNYVPGYAEEYMHMPDYRGGAYVEADYIGSDYYGPRLIERPGNYRGNYRQRGRKRAYKSPQGYRGGDYGSYSSGSRNEYYGYDRPHRRAANY